MRSNVISPFPKIFPIITPHFRTISPFSVEFSQWFAGALIFDYDSWNSSNSSGTSFVGGRFELIREGLNDLWIDRLLWKVWSWEAVSFASLKCMLLEAVKIHKANIYILYHFNKHVFKWPYFQNVWLLFRCIHIQ